MGGETRLTVRVVLRASRMEIEGITEDGALVAFLADVLGVPKRDVAIVRGARSCAKVVTISATPATMRERLRAAISPSAT